MTATRTIAIRGAALLLAVGAVLLPPSSRAQQKLDFKTVPPEVLLETPQAYWARGIVFEDVLLRHPRGRSEKFNDSRYVEMETEALGECYAHEDLVEQIGNLELNQSYLFSGTVVQRKRNRYEVLIEAVTVRMDNASELAADIRALAENPDLVAEGTELQVLADLAGLIEQRLFAYMEERDLDPSEVFSDSESANLVMQDISRSSIRQMEQDSGLRSSELLASYLSRVVARKYSPEVGTPLPGSGDLQPDEDAPDSFEDVFAPAPREMPPPEDGAETGMPDIESADEAAVPEEAVVREEDETRPPDDDAGASDIEALFAAAEDPVLPEEPELEMPPLDMTPEMDEAPEEPEPPVVAGAEQPPAPVEEMDDLPELSDASPGVAEIDDVLDELGMEEPEETPEVEADPLDLLDAELAELTEEPAAAPEETDAPAADPLEALEAELAELAPVDEPEVDEPGVDEPGMDEVALDEPEMDLPAEVEDPLAALDAELAGLAEPEASEAMAEEAGADPLAALEAELAELDEADPLEALDLELASLTDEPAGAEPVAEPVEEPMVEPVDEPVEEPMEESEEVEVDPLAALEAELAELDASPAEPVETVEAPPAVEAAPVAPAVDSEGIDALDLLDAELAGLDEVEPIDEVEILPEPPPPEPSGPTRVSIGPFRYPILEQ